MCYQETDSCKLSSFINNLSYNPLLKEKQRKIKTKTLEILADGNNLWVIYSYPFVLLPDDCFNQWAGKKKNFRNSKVKMVCYQGGSIKSVNKDVL